MLILYLLIFASGLTVLMGFLGNPWWALILEFIGFVIVGVLLFFGFAFFVLLFTKKRKEEDMPKPIFNYVNSIACQFLVTLFGIKVIYEGKELIDKNRVYFVVANHQSILDPVIIIHTTKMKKLALLMKKEVKNIILVGKWLHEGGFYFIDRENAREAIKPINDSADAIKKGRTMGAFVEGTRSKGPNMGEFRDGVFRIAKKSNAPILVITVDNCYRIHEHFPWRRTTVLVKVCKVIEPEEFAGKHTKEISQNVKEIMTTSLNEAREKYPVLGKK